MDLCADLFIHLLRIAAHWNRLSWSRCRRSPSAALVLELRGRQYVFFDGVVYTVFFDGVVYPHSLTVLCTRVLVWPQGIATHWSEGLHVITEWTLVSSSRTPRGLLVITEWRLCRMSWMLVSSSQYLKDVFKDFLGVNVQGSLGSELRTAPGWTGRRGSETGRTGSRGSCELPLLRQGSEDRVPRTFAGSGCNGTGCR